LLLLLLLLLLLVLLLYIYIFCIEWFINYIIVIIIIIIYHIWVYTGFKKNYELVIFKWQIIVQEDATQIFVVSVLSTYYATLWQELYLRFCVGILWYQVFEWVVSIFYAILLYMQNFIKNGIIVNNSTFKHK